MSKQITEVNINIETKDASIATKELIIGSQYEYSSQTITLSDVDKIAILAIFNTYL